MSDPSSLDQTHDSPNALREGRLAPATPLNPRRRGIIVGASDGLGEVLAHRLAHEGYSLALLARRKDKLEAVCHEINQTLGRQSMYPYVHDVC